MGLIYFLSLVVALLSVSSWGGNARFRVTKVPLSHREFDSVVKNFFKQQSKKTEDAIGRLKEHLNLDLHRSKV